MTEDQTPGAGAPRAELRRELRARRRALPASQRIEAANGLAGQLLALPFAPVSGLVAGYWAVDGEIALHAWQLGLPSTITYCLPTLHADGSLRFAPWKPGGPLKTNVHGIPEPDVADDALVQAESMEFVVAPLVGFDGDARRLGMGGGWYDRTFAFRRQRPAPPWLVGAGFACQAVDQLQDAAWDVPMDAVCSESRTYRQAVP